MLGGWSIGGLSRRSQTIQPHPSRRLGVERHGGRKGKTYGGGGVPAPKARQTGHHGRAAWPARRSRCPRHALLARLRRVQHRCVRPHRGRGPSRRRTAAPLLCSSPLRSGTALRPRRRRLPQLAGVEARLSATQARTRRPHRARALSDSASRAARSLHTAASRRDRRPEPAPATL